MDGVVKIGAIAFSSTGKPGGPDTFKADLKKLGKEILSLENNSLAERTQLFEELSKQEAWATNHSFNQSRLAGLFRWCMGVLLIRVKAELGHGKYGPWLKENRERLGFTQRTAENYTKLAKSHQTLESFLESLQPKSDADEAGGNEEEPTVSTDEAGSRQVDNQPTKVKVVLKDFTKVQKSCRHLIESDEAVSRPQLAQIRSVKRELDKLLEQMEGRIDED